MTHVSPTSRPNAVQEQLELERKKQNKTQASGSTADPAAVDTPLEADDRINPKLKKEIKVVLEKAKQKGTLTLSEKKIEDKYTLYQNLKASRDEVSGRACAEYSID